AALEIKPDDSLLAALERLLGQQGQHQEQANVLRQLASRAVEPAARRELLSRAGEALLKSGQPDSAADAYTSALATDPADAAAIAGLESLLDSPSAKARAAKALEPVYRGRKDAAHLAVVLENTLAEARPEARPALFKEIVALRESLGHGELAFASLLAAFAESPADVRVRADLQRLAATTGSFGELADEIASQLERPLPPALALELWRTQAELFSGPVGRPDRAAAAWREVAQRAPGDPEALDQLELLYQAESDFESLFSLLADRAERVAAGERPALFLRMAQLAAERLNDPARAVDACRQVLAIDPANSGAAILLEGLLEETGRTAELVARLEERIRALREAGDATEMADLLTRAAELTQNDGPRSLTLLQAAFDAQPDHAGATDLAERMMRPGGPMRGEAAALLQPIYEARGDMARVAQALQARADAEADVARKVELLHRLTELQAGPLWNPQAAFSAAASALTALPDDLRALRDCLQWHEVAGRTDALVALLEETAPRATDARQGSEILRGLGMLQESQGSDAKAIDTWRGLLALEPADAPALERLARLLEGARRSDELLEVLRRQLELADTDERRATLLRRMAVLRQDALGDAPGALETFRKLRALRPDDPEALERMDGLCEAASLWSELEEILGRRVHGSTAPGPTAMALELRLAALRLEKLGKTEDAVPLYAGILARDPRQATALARLEGLSTSGGGDGRILDVLLEAYRASGDNVRRAAALEARAAVGTPAERRALLLELAECRGALGQTDLAFLSLARCFQENRATRTFSGVCGRWPTRRR
ncbi:MAG TPA: hypothetical protein VH208_07130, partial [Myxococcaceae bacterium]|nr:hypothetical protein [Myxococcaceae bacterium]